MKKRLFVGVFFVPFIVIIGIFYFNRDDNKRELEAVSHVFKNYEATCAEIKQMEMKNVHISEDCFFDVVDSDARLFNIISKPHNLSVVEATSFMNSYLENLGYQNVGITDCLYITNQLFNPTDEEYNEDCRYLASNYLWDRPYGNAMWISVPNCVGVQTLDGGIYSYCDSEMKKNAEIIDDDDMLLGAFEKYIDKGDSYENIDSQEFDDVLYTTIDGTLSVKEASAEVKSLFRQYLFNSKSRENFDVDLNLRKVCLNSCSKKTIFGFEATRRYKGVAIAFVDNGYYNSMEFNGDCIHMYVAQKGSISAFRGMSENILSEYREINKIYSLKDAYEMISRHLADDVSFEVKRISMSYAQTEDSTEKSEKKYVPGWLFEGINMTNNVNISVFVDAEKGDIFINIWS